MIKDRLDQLQADFIKYGFEKFSYSERELRAYAMGCGDERLRLCRELETVYPNIASLIFGEGGD